VNECKPLVGGPDTGGVLAAQRMSSAALAGGPSPGATLAAKAGRCTFTPA